MTPPKAKPEKDHKKLDLPKREKLKFKITGHSVEGKKVILTVEALDQKGKPKAGSPFTVPAPMHVLSSRPEDQAEIRLKTILENLSRDIYKQENAGKLDGFEYEF